MINTNLVKYWLSLAEEPNASPEILDRLLNLLLEELTELAQSGTTDNQKRFISRLESERWRMLYSLKERNTIDIIELRDAVADINVVNANVAYHFGLDESADFEEVMKSNFSKYCTTEEDARKTVELYATAQHPDKLGEMIDCDYKQKGEYFIVFRKTDGKIMKSYKYKKVSL